MSGFVRFWICELPAKPKEVVDMTAVYALCGADRVDHNINRRHSTVEAFLDRAVEGMGKVPSEQTEAEAHTNCSRCGRPSIIPVKVATNLPIHYPYTGKEFGA